MSGPALAKARLIPFGDAPNATVPEEAQAIPFDFNPETLTLKVSTGQARDPARRGRQQTQNAGASQATLSFECIFDSTRPRDSDGETSLRIPVRQRDVRRRTRAIADLLQDVDPGQQAAPRRVRFLWGEFLFDGVVSQHQETFDYFSAEGVPLRSKVALTLTEKNFRYNVTAAQADPLRDGAAAFGSSPGGNDPPPPETPRQRSEAVLAAALVPDVSRPSPPQIGQRLAAGLPLGATQALVLFGAAALPSGAVLPPFTASGAVNASDFAPTGATPQPGRPSSSWGRDAAPAGSASAGLAARVVAQRQAGLDPGPGPDSRVAAGAEAARPPGRPTPQTAPAAPPICGHAHLRLRLALEPDPRIFPLPPRPERPPLERRPSWEPEAWRRGRATAGDATSIAARGGCACGCGCGCIPCRGGER